MVGLPRQINCGEEKVKMFNINNLYRRLNSWTVVLIAAAVLGSIVVFVKSAPAQSDLPTTLGPRRAGASGRKPNPHQWERRIGFFGATGALIAFQTEYSRGYRFTPTAV